MKVKYTAHALHKMAEPRIQPDWVTATIEGPEYLRPDPNQVGAVRAFRGFPNMANDGCGRRTWIEWAKERRPRPAR